MNVEDLRKVASGRVWSGTQAKEKGLVDILGNFDDAIRQCYHFQFITCL